MQNENQKYIIKEQDIVNTYNVYQQDQTRLYRQYKCIKQQNPEYGYKRIAKLLDQPYAKTRWWHAGKYTPYPVQTVEILQEKRLVSLKSNNSNLKLIVKVLGALFGDGGIFGNLNGIFLSSSELDAVKEFGEDLKKLFGDKIEENARVIEGGEYGHSWCYQNTNRAVIRFFMTLGTPIGDKSLIPLYIPEWIKQSRSDIQDEFYGSFFGGEIGIPKVHIDKNRLDTLALGITATDEFAENRIEFLQEVANYLNQKGIKTGKISINDHKKCNRAGTPTKIYRLLISTGFENVTNFITLTKMHYCKYKYEKILSTMNQFSDIKRQRFNDLIDMEYTEEAAATLLKLSPVSLEILHNFEDFKEIGN